MQEDDLSKELAALEKDSRDRLSGIYSSLQSDLDAAREARIRAEKDAEEAKRKYSAALELQKEQYALVIQEIFDKPKRDLIRKISRYSLGGLVATLIVATFSLSFTAVLQDQFADSLMRRITIYVNDILVAVEKSDEESHELFRDLDFRNAMVDRGVQEIVRHFDKERGKFDSYPTKAVLARAYKIMPVDVDDFPSGFLLPSI